MCTIIYFCIFFLPIGVNQPNVEVTIAKIVVGLICSWIIAWTPYSAIALLGISGHSYLLTPLSSMLPALFAKTSACIDPFIYSLNHPKIRQEILFRIYNCFLVSTGRRGESLNSDSVRVPEWKISGSARLTNRNGVLLHHNSTQHGRVGSVASSRRLNKGHQAAVVYESKRSVSVKEELKRSMSLSSAESRTVGAEGFETADIIAAMISRSQELKNSYHLHLLGKETSCTDVKEGSSTKTAHLFSIPRLASNSPLPVSSL